MNYFEAVKRVESYSYLLNEDITNRKTKSKSKISIITISPTDGSDKSGYMWLQPNNREYAAFLLNKDCVLLFILDFNKWGSIKGTFIEESALKNYYLSKPNDPSSSINPMP